MLGKLASKIGWGKFDKSLLTVTTSLGSISLVTLAMPLFWESIFNNLIGTLSTIVLSGYSEAAVAATGTVNIVFTLFLVLFISIASGASMVISNLIGAEQLKRAESGCWASVILLGSIGFICTVMMLTLSSQVITWMNLTGEVYELALIYLRIRSIALPLQALYSVFLAIMRCYGYPKSAVVTGAITNVCNLLFSFYAVYYAKIPELSGVSGVAWGNVLSQLIGLLIVLGVFLKLKLKLRRPETVAECGSYFGKILTIGIPTTISNGSFTLSQIITNSFAVLLGIHAVSGKIYFTTILSYAYLFSSSFGNANSLLIGRLCGAGQLDHARRLNNAVVKFTIPANLLVSLLIILLREPILSLFTDNQLIIDMALGILLVDLIVEQARAVSHVYEYALRAAGDVTKTMIVTLVSGWVFSVGLAYVLSIPCGMGLIGCWIGLAIDESIRAIFTFIRWQKGKWVANLV